MTTDPWYPLLALVECGDSTVAAPPLGPSSAMAREAVQGPPPSTRLRDALLSLREAMQAEFGTRSGGGTPGQFWLLLDITGERADTDLEVGRVLEEIRSRFQNLAAPAITGSAPPEADFEGFLREKLIALGFDELNSAPLLPDLQREALRGLGVGLGSQLAQLIGRMAGWHGESRGAAAPAKASRGGQGPARLLRMELGARLGADREVTSGLRVEMARIRRKASQLLGWELSPVLFALGKDLDENGWRLVLRGQEIAGANSPDGLLQQFEETLVARSSSLLTYGDFETMVRQPGCKLVVRELRAMGLEKAVLWMVCRRLLEAGANLREPLTVLERLLEASVVSHEMSFLVESVLGV